MRYIDADKLMEAIEKNIEPYKSWDCTKADVVMDTILEQPTADVVEVVRCEKCKDFEPHGNGKAGICRNKNLKPCLRYATDFCSYGDRK